MWFKFFFLLQKNEGNSENKNYHDVWKLFLLIMLIVFWQENNAIFHHLELLKKWIILHNLSYVLKHKQDIFFLFLAYKALKAIVTLFFPIFFQSSFSDEKFIPSQLYLFIKSLIFVILCRSFLFLQDLTRRLQRIEKICYLFYWRDLLLFFWFLSN